MGLASGVAVVGGEGRRSRAGQAVPLGALLLSESGEQEITQRRPPSSMKRRHGQTSGESRIGWIMERRGVSFSSNSHQRFSAMRGSPVWCPAPKFQPPTKAGESR